ncbi:MAG: RNA chaperone Hfq [Proteobacteria bacterium]|jgi:host factor-I protein|nr:RNA chaperone Hfq [Pseudomonadota bacterium]
MDNLQQSYLEDLCNNTVHIAIYLINGIKLSGWINSFDDSCILLRDNNDTMTQLIYKHAVSTIVPTKTHLSEVK